MKKTILLGWTVFLASTTAAYSAPLGSLIITAALSIGAGSLLPVAVLQLLVGLLPDLR